MSQIQNMDPTKLRVDFARADRYVYPEAPRLNFGQKLLRGFGRFMSFAGPVGAAVTAIALPGIGLPIAAGLYGLGRVSQDQLYKSEVRDQIAKANQPQVTSLGLPGLFESHPIDAGSVATNFMAPSSMEPRISDVVIERDSARGEALNSARF